MCASYRLDRSGSAEQSHSCGTSGSRVSLWASGWKATGKWRTVSDAESALLDGNLSAEPSFLGGGDLDDSDAAVLGGSLHFLSAEEEAVRGHRAGMVTDLAPAEGKNGRGGWRRTSWVTSLSEFEEAGVGVTKSGAQQCEAFVVSVLPSCQSLGREDVKGRGLAGM